MKQVLIALTLTFALGACSNNDGSNDSDGSRIGHVLFTGVEGLRYQTASQSGSTGSRGEFRYYPGETVTFSVGSLILAQDIPAKDWITPIDFEPDEVAKIDAGEQVDGLTTHAFLESAAAGEKRIINKMRFLLTIDDDRDPENGIQIKSYVVDAINAFDFATEGEIDWSANAEDTFGKDTLTDRVENKLINSICFPELPQTTCDDPEAGRIYTGAVSASRLLKEQLQNITRSIGEDIFVDNEFYEIPEGDHDLRTVRLVMIREHRDLDDMEVISTDDSVVTVQNWDKNSQEATFFATGQKGQEATVILNLKLANDYRWIKKNVRITIR